MDNINSLSGEMLIERTLRDVLQWPESHSTDDLLEQLLDYMTLEGRCIKIEWYKEINKWECIWIKGFNKVFVSSEESSVEAVCKCALLGIAHDRGKRKDS